MILKLQFEICLEIVHDVLVTVIKYLNQNIKNKLPLGPSFRLVLTVADGNGHRRCKYRRYTIDVSYCLTPVAILG